MANHSHQDVDPELRKTYLVTYESLGKDGHKKGDGDVFWGPITWDEAPVSSHFFLWDL